MAGIYIHIPFCHSKCAYCDFYSRAGALHADSYISALAREYRQRINETGGQEINTIYVGGGTPSILSPVQFRKLADIFKDHKPAEFTLEANPEDIEAARLETWAECGVNRISMGIQSLVDTELRFVGRRHTAATALEAIEKMRSSGFRNISCDLIYGLPGQTPDTWRYSVDRLLECRPEHLSAYCLTIEPGTALGVKLRRGEFKETDDETIAAYYDYLCRATRNAGYEHYEISNFSLSGYHSRHNSSYWDSTPYLGLGPGAHSLGADGQRRYVDTDLKKYMESPADCLLIDEETETEKINDIIFTGLRTSKGLDIEKIPARFMPEFNANAEAMLKDGSLRKEGSRLFIEEDRWLTSDAIIRELLLV